MASDALLKEEMNKLSNVASIIADMLIDDVKKEWVKQGHELTGDYTASLKKIVSIRVSDVAVDVYGNLYGVILDGGVRAERIPFKGTAKRGQGTGGTSKYIQGLVQYVKMRIDTTAGEKKALSIAFAIAKTQAKDGMPTKNSFKFSSTGKRTDFIKDVLAKSGKAAQELASEEMGRVIDVVFTRIIDNFNKQAS